MSDSHTFQDTYRLRRVAIMAGLIAHGVHLAVEEPQVQHEDRPSLGLARGKSDIMRSATRLRVTPLRMRRLKGCTYLPKSPKR